jgi:hypothetical protein
MNEPFEETMLSFSPSGGVANAEKYSQHRDWYAEHSETVSEIGETKRCTGLLFGLDGTQQGIQAARE